MISTIPNGILIDAAIAVLCILGCMIGRHRGLWKSLGGFIVSVGSLVGSVILSKIGTEHLSRILAPIYSEKVVALIRQAGLDAIGKEDLSFDKVETGIEFIDRIIQASLDKIEAAAGSVMDVIGNAVDQMAQTIISAVIHVILFILIFIILAVVLKALVKLINKVFKLPVLKQINRFAGGIFGILEVLVLVCVTIYFTGILGLTFFADNMEGALLLPALNGLLH